MPAFMHLAHTFMRVGPPSVATLILWMFGFQRRFVLRWEWLTLKPKPGFLPHISHILDFFTSSEHTRVCYQNRPRAYKACPLLQQERKSLLAPPPCVQGVGGPRAQGPCPMVSPRARRARSYPAVPGARLPFAPRGIIVYGPCGLL